MLSSDFSVYLHCPFCAHRCPYCDFNIHVRKKIPQHEFQNALIKEASFHAQHENWASRRITTVFFGGGTPSLLEAEIIAKTIEGLRSLWNFDPEAEISMEANPEDLTLKNLTDLYQAGINRLSIGVQSFNNSFLKKLGRVHSAEKAMKSVEWAKSSGFSNISIDLMFALPDQRLSDLEADLRQAIELGTQHISYYNLSIESGTDFYSRHQGQRLNLPDDQESAGMMNTIIDSLSASNFTHYEVSNYARPGFECIHNKGYWEARDYLGLGPGAHSACSSVTQNSEKSVRRWVNRSDPENYIARSTNCKAWEEVLESKELLFERIFLGLRLLRGMELTPIYSALSVKAAENLRLYFKQLLEDGFLISEQENLKLSRQGILLLDSIMEKISSCLKL